MSQPGAIGVRADHSDPLVVGPWGQPDAGHDRGVPSGPCRVDALKAGLLARGGEGA